MVIKHGETKRYCVYIGGQEILQSQTDGKTYQVKSTVLGGAVIFKHITSSTWHQNGSTNNSTYNDTGIYLNGNIVANMSWNTWNEYQFSWNHEDIVGTTRGESGISSSGGVGFTNRYELDPLGTNVETANPYNTQPPPETDPPWWGEMASPEQIEFIEVDGVLMALSQAMSLGRNAIIAGHWKLEYQLKTTETCFSVIEDEPNNTVSIKSCEQKRFLTSKFINDDDDFPSLKNILDAAVIMITRVEFFSSGEEGNKVEDKKNKEAIFAMLLWIFISPACNEAFRKAGIPNPKDVISQRGLTIAPYGTLLSQEQSKRLGISEEDRKEILNGGKNLSIPAFTARSEDPNERIYMFFKNTAFMGTNWIDRVINGFYQLEEIVVHESIHVSGVGEHYVQKPIVGGNWGHDLHGYPHYKDILAACRIDK